MNEIIELIQKLWVPLVLFGIMLILVLLPDKKDKKQIIIN